MDLLLFASNYVWLLNAYPSNLSHSLYDLIKSMFASKKLPRKEKNTMKNYFLMFGFLMENLKKKKKKKVKYK